jgi:hypothetical protein
VQNAAAALRGGGRGVLLVEPAGGAA